MFGIKSPSKPRINSVSTVRTCSKQGKQIAGREIFDLRISSQGIPRESESEHDVQDEDDEAWEEIRKDPEQKDRCGHAKLSIICRFSLKFVSRLY